MAFAIIFFALLTVVYGSPSLGKIVGGDKIDITQAPYVVSLLYLKIQICGGSLITLRVVLTAAHCVHNKDQKDLTVHAGSSNTYIDGVIVEVEKVHIHHKYDHDSRTYDAGIVKLPHALARSDKINTILVSNQRPTNNKNVFVCGWGDIKENGNPSPILMGAYLKTIDKSYCSSKYVRIITESMFCAGHMPGGVDTCQGDSGGPAVMQKGNTKYLIGIVSWGAGCGRAGVPGVYTDVSTIIGWIANLV